MYCTAVPEGTDQLNSISNKLRCAGSYLSCSWCRGNSRWRAGTGGGGGGGGGQAQAGADGQLGEGVDRVHLCVCV